MTAATKRSFLRVVGYAVFFCVAFVIALLITFPYDRLTAFVEEKATDAIGREVSITRLRPTITGAIYLEDVTIGPSTEEPPDPGQAPMPLVRLDSATVRVGLLALILGGTDVSFAAELADGTAEGSFSQDDEELALSLLLENLNARRLPILREKVGLPIKGSIDGEIDLTIPAGEAKKSSGSIELSLKGMVIGDGESKLSISRFAGYGSSSSSSSDEDEGMVIQPITIGPVVLASKLVKGVADIPQIEASSEDAELTFEGSVKLREPIGRSNVDTYLTLKIADAYVEQDEATQDVMKLVNVYLRKSKRTDGAFGFRLRGTLGGGVGFKMSKTFRSARGGDRNRSAKRRSRPRRERSRPQRPAAQNAEEEQPAPRLGPPARGPNRPRGGESRSDTFPSGMPRPPIATIPRPVVPPQQESAEEAEEATEESSEDGSEEGEEEGEEDE